MEEIYVKLCIFDNHKIHVKKFLPLFCKLPRSHVLFLWRSFGTKYLLLYAHFAKYSIKHIWVTFVQNIKKYKNQPI
jgi:hypothetical protein